MNSGAWSEPVVFRPAVVEDAEALADIWVARVGGDRDQAIERSGRVIESAEGEAFLLAAEVAGVLVGYGRILRFLKPEDSPATTVPSGWYLLGLGVRQDMRRRGIATELTRRRLEWMRERAIERALYFANDDNEISIRLHEKFGFKRVRRGVTYPRMREPDVPMSLYALSLI